MYSSLQSGLFLVSKDEFSVIGGLLGHVRSPTSSKIRQKQKSYCMLKNVLVASEKHKLDSNFFSSRRDDLAYSESGWEQYPRFMYFWQNIF